MYPKDGEEQRVEEIRTPRTLGEPLVFAKLPPVMDMIRPSSSTRSAG
jgi:hypothetical protein